MSKWQKYKVLRQSPVLRKHVPKTRRFNKNKFRSMLGEFERVIIKPAGGSGGQGVQRVRKKGHGLYEVRFENHTKMLSGSTRTYQFVNKKNRSKMIVQRHIQLAKVNSRPLLLTLHEVKGKS